MRADTIDGPTQHGAKSRSK